MLIKLLPVYSQLAGVDEEEQFRIHTPTSSKLFFSKHQRETFEALLDPKIEVVFNTAMTGDGKSLAAYLPVLVRGWHAFGMYPTNELLRDQRKQFEEYLRLFGLTTEQTPLTTLWGAEMARLQNENNFRARGEFLKERFSNHNVVLTNPDIFNLVMNYAYARGSRMFTPQELPYSLATNFDYFIMDEFHIFAMPQIVAALTAMLYLVNQSGYPKKFLFSSATMSDSLREMVARSGLKYREIKGAYGNGAAPHYRQVLYESDLHLHKLEQDDNAETWVRGHVDEMVSFWRSCEGRVKGAIIVNSVVAARRIARFLEEALKPHNISIGENTGLTDEEQKRVALEKQIVVGTATIDVGVDFNINFLVFESVNAGTFLQRLGRLGRVKRDQHAFAKYTAHALLSAKTPWVYDKLVKKFQERGIGEGDAVDRPTILREVVAESFPNENDFAAYAKRWGILQAAQVVNVLEDKKNQGAYTSLAEELKAKYATMFGVKSLEPAQKRYWAVANNEERGKKILDEVLGFRGSSPFQVACWDATVEPNAFLAYDLLPLVSSTNYVTVEREDYERAVERRYAEPNQRAEPFNALKYSLAVCRRDM